jgi:putative PIN family toxin of toxin-antitoxin system
VSPRKDRIAVVLDTNVVIGYYLSTHPQSANARVYLLWRTRRALQLVVSDETVTEYMEVLKRVGIPDVRVQRLEERIRKRETVTHVNLGARPTESRDPDDNLMLATAAAGRAAYLVTNDRDLLDIPADDRKRFKFAILTPAQFLAELEEKAKA